MSVAEALEKVRQAQGNFDLMLHAFNQLEANDGICSKSSQQFSSLAVHSYDDELTRSQQRLADTQATNTTELLQKVLMLIHPDDNDALKSIKPEIERFLGIDDDHDCGEPEAAKNTPIPITTGGDRVPLNVPKDVLEKLSLWDLFALREATENQFAGLSGTEHAYELAYDLYTAFRKELMSREPKDFEDLALILMSMFQQEDFGSWAGADEVYERCSAFIKRRFGRHEPREEAA